MISSVTAKITVVRAFSHPEHRQNRLADGWWQRWPGRHRPPDPAITGVPPRVRGGTVVRIWRVPPVS